MVVQFLKSEKWNAGERNLVSHLGIEWYAMGDGALAAPPATPARVPNSAPERWPSLCWPLRRTAPRAAWTTPQTTFLKASIRANSQLGMEDAEDRTCVERWGTSRLT